jgi:hypothetical protein
MTSLASFLAKELPAPGLLPVRAWWSSPNNFFRPKCPHQIVSRANATMAGSEHVERKKPIRQYSSSLAVKTASSDDVHQQAIISKLRPHVFIHLARSRFGKPDEFRKQWETEGLVNDTLKRILQDHGAYISAYIVS